MKIKARQKQLTKYTKEEKYGLFTEGKIRVPAPQKSKKTYSRKVKHKKKLWVMLMFSKSML